MIKINQRYAMAEAQLSWHQQSLKQAIAEVLPAAEPADQPPPLSYEAINALFNEADLPLANYPAFIERGICENQSLPPAAILSPNQRYLAVQKIDEQAVADCPLMQAVPSGHSLRPKDNHFKLGLPGDLCLPMASILIADLDQNSTLHCDRAAIEASNGGLVEGKRVFWGSDNQLYMIEQSRDRCCIEFVQVDPATGKSRVLLSEQGSSFLQVGPLPFSEPLVRVLPESHVFIWYSQASGWGQLYLHDLRTGELINAITTGASVVTQLHAIDEAQCRLYFSACGNGDNLYHEQLYGVSLDGTACQLLTPEQAQHDIHAICVKSQTFVDSFSRVDLPTQVVVRRLTDGAVVSTCLAPEEAMKAAAHFNHPIGFTAKAADKVTDLNGVIYRPGDFNETNNYPVILAIYGTPHECIVPTRYAQSSDIVRDIYRSLAELGFVVVMVDPRGTPLRGKVFHDFAYGQLHNGGCIDDQVAVLRQLGRLYTWMDMDRVGITGHSGGGYASARAMMTHPELFKVCVSSAGNHDQRLYVAGWAETFQGLVAEDNYAVFSNESLVPQLAGKLLLVHGDSDANVHIAHTLQLVDQLINHNKDFDLLILPNRGHVHARDGYFIRRLWDYFVEHLQGNAPAKAYAITPPTD